VNRLAATISAVGATRRPFRFRGGEQSGRRRVRLLSALKLAPQPERAQLCPAVDPPRPRGAFLCTASVRPIWQLPGGRIFVCSLTCAMHHPPILRALRPAPRLPLSWAGPFVWDSPLFALCSILRKATQIPRIWMRNPRDDERRFQTIVSAQSTRS
jgi:hypothetical protein